MEGEDNEILVVEGQIIGGTECEFVIQRSFCKHEDYEQSGPNLVNNAKVYIICSNGQVFGAERHNDGHYYVNLGDLDPNETYNLLIKLTKEGTYESEPMYPMPGSELKQLSYTLSDDGSTVQIRLTNEDPHKGMYYLWTYDEHWEINTPLETEWRYDPESDAIVRVEQKTNRGWCSKRVHPIILGNNFDYGNGSLQDYGIYTLSNMDKRFNTRYHTTVHQITISKEEYEYYKQMEAQSTQTGGLFTLMPAQLPTNIHNDKGLMAEGYIGVHLNSSDADIYINRGDVGYKDSRTPEIIPDSIVKKEEWLGTLYNQGYRVYHYNQFLKKSEWTRPWCIDCRDPYWGASLDRPDFWEDK